MEQLKGIAVSKGIAIGNVLCYKVSAPEISKLMDRDRATELARFEVALAEAVEKLSDLHEHALKSVGEEEAMLFDIHAMMLQDADYTDSVKGIIEAEGCNAEYAVKETAELFADMFRQMDDEYMRAREADVRDVSERLIRVLCGTDKTPLERIRGQVVVAAEDLMPSETIQMDQTKVLAFVTRMGSKISHSAILARTMGIPAVVGLGDEFDRLCENDVVIVDGLHGDVILNPDEAVLQKYRAERDIYLEKQQLLRQLIGQESISLDGKKVELCANIGHPSDVAACLANDADGIGLFRSEFLYMESHEFPSEETQFEAYKSVLTQMGDQRRVIVRTLDLGADKQAPYFQLPQEDNPAMGYRAIRICLQEPEMFHTQLRALHRASMFGKLAIMFPMITSVQEIREIKDHIQLVKTQLRERGQEFREDIEYGVMIETPAAVMICDRIAKEVDFFSIGTNDLTQYALACDRMNARLNDLYDPASLPVLRMIALVVRHAHRAGIWVGICGESAADADLMAFYLRIGVDELSVSPSSILDMRNKVRHTDSSEVTDRVLSEYIYGFLE